MSTLASVVAAKNVDLPTLGLPTSPMRRADPPSFFLGGRSAQTGYGDVELGEVDLTVSVDVDGRNQTPHVPWRQVGDLGPTKRILEFAGVNGATVIEVNGPEEGEHVLLGFIEVIRQHLEFLGHRVSVLREFRHLVVVKVSTDGDDRGARGSLPVTANDQLGVEPNATAEEGTCLLYTSPSPRDCQ